MHSLAKGTCASAVNDLELLLFCKVGLVQICLQHLQGILRTQSPQIHAEGCFPGVFCALGRGLVFGVFADLPKDLALGLCRTCLGLACALGRPGKDAHLRPESHAAHVYAHALLLFVHIPHNALLAKDRVGDAVSHSEIKDRGLDLSLFLGFVHVLCKVGPDGRHLL